MTPARVEETRELADTLPDAAGRLSAAHVAVLVAHPDAVRSALAAAVDALSTGDRERRSAVETIEGGEPVLVGVRNWSGASRRGRTTARRKPC